MAANPISSASPGMTSSVTNTLRGVLTFDTGLSASRIDTRLYNIGFAGQYLKVGETRSDAQGKYSISYTPPQGALPNLQVRVVDSSGKEVTISHTKFNAQPSETLNLVVPSSVQPLASEFQRLSADTNRSMAPSRFRPAVRLSVSIPQSLSSSHREYQYGQ
jgi:hypothetical protein